MRQIIESLETLKSRAEMSTQFEIKRSNQIVLQVFMQKVLSKRIELVSDIAGVFILLTFTKQKLNNVENYSRFEKYSLRSEFSFLDDGSGHTYIMCLSSKNTNEHIKDVIVNILSEIFNVKKNERLTFNVTS